MQALARALGPIETSAWALDGTTGSFECKQTVHVTVVFEINEARRVCVRVCPVCLSLESRVVSALEAAE